MKKEIISATGKPIRIGDLVYRGECSRGASGVYGVVTGFTPAKVLVRETYLSGKVIVIRMEDKAYDKNGVTNVKNCQGALVDPYGLVVVTDQLQYSETRARAYGRVLGDIPDIIKMLNLYGKEDNT